jgi:hypothetical protein
VAAARGTLSLSHTPRWTIRYKIAAPQTEARRLDDYVAKLEL